MCDEAQNTLRHFPKGLRGKEDKDCKQTQHIASASKGPNKEDRRQKREVQKTIISLARGPRKQNVKSHYSFNEPRRKLLLTASLVYVMDFRGVSVLCKVVLNSGSESHLITEALNKSIVSSYGH